MLPSQQISALNDGRQLPKVRNLAAFLPTGLNRLDQISQVDFCQLSQAKPVDVPVIHPLAELHEEEEEFYKHGHATRLWSYSIHMDRWAAAAGTSSSCKGDGAAECSLTITF